MPRKGAASSESTRTKHEPKQDPPSNNEHAQTKPLEKKRKSSDPIPERVLKAARRSTRGAKKAEPTREQLLGFLLSSDAEELCRPDDESEAVKQNGSLRTYSSSVLNPFEELLSAIILSRPISHRLGLRSIRTVLNSPYNFTSAQAVRTAGDEKRHQALWDAKTQHKDKTADQIGLVAEVTLEKFTTKDDSEGTQLQKALDDTDNDIQKALGLLKDNIKGLGKTGLEIFLRRVQWLWDAGYPFADGRSLQGLKKLGLPDDAEELKDAIENLWGRIDTKHLAGEEEEARKRRAFVVVLERATGADLEGKIDALLEAATGS